MAKLMLRICAIVSWQRRGGFAKSPSEWPTLSDPGMEEAFFDTPLLREFASLPDERTILRFCYRVKEHKLAKKIVGVVNNILIRRRLLLKAGTVVEAAYLSDLLLPRDRFSRRARHWHGSALSLECRGT